MSTVFLICVAIFPRWVLAVAWIMGAVPANDTPLWLDALAFTLCPYWLVAWWLYAANANALLVLGFITLGALDIMSGGSDEE